MTKKTIGQIKKSLANFANATTLEDQFVELVFNRDIDANKTQELLDKGMESNGESCGSPILSWAVASWDPSVVETVLNVAGVDTEVRDQANGDTPLMTAIGSSAPRRSQIVELLIDAGADVNAQNRRSVSPLMLAVSSRNKKLVQFLLTHNADINARTRDGRTPLFIAIWNGDLELVKTLIEAGADIDDKALSLAQDGSHTKIASYLHSIMNKTSRYFRPSPPPRRKPTRISRNTARLLQGWRKEPLSKEYVVDPDLEFGDARGPLAGDSFAKRKGRNFSRRSHITPLRKKNNRLTDRLGNFSSYNKDDEEQCVALYEKAIKKASRGNFGELQELIKDGCPVNCRDKDGWTPLKNAVFMGSCKAAKLLIDAGAKVNEYSEDYDSPLFVALKRRKHKMVELLLENGANPDDNDGFQSAIECAVLCGDLQSVRHLLRHDATFGDSLVELAEVNDHPKIAYILRGNLFFQRKYSRSNRNFSRSRRKPHQRNFSYEGNNLADKCRIINGNLFGENEDYYLNPEDLIKFLENCRETWTCQATKDAPEACTHLIEVLKFFVDGDEKPNSLAVYRPSEIVASSTKPLVLLGVEEPTKIDMDEIKQNILYLAYRVYDADPADNSVKIDFGGKLWEELANDNWDYFEEWRDDRIKEFRSEAIDETKDMLWCDIVDLTGHDDLLANIPIREYIDKDTGEVYDDALFEAIATSLVDKYFPEYEQEAFSLWDNKLRYEIAMAEASFPLYCGDGREMPEIISAIIDGDMDEIRRAIVAAGDVDVFTNTTHDTPLTEAAQNSDNELLKLLIDGGAEVNYANDMGETALMFTVRGGNVEGTKLLLNAGADVTRKNYAGKTALMLAHKKEIIDLLKKAGATE